MAHFQPLSRDELPQFLERFEHHARTRGFVPNSLLTMSRRTTDLEERALEVASRAIGASGGAPGKRAP